MKTRVHAVAGAVGLVLVTTFFLVSVAVEVRGDPALVANAKTFILYGVCLLIPTMAVTGASGRSLMGDRRGPRVLVKQRRMIAIGAIGLLVLTPCAILLYGMAAAGDFGAAFVVLQGVEFVGGAVNIVLLGLNFRDGMLLTGRIRRRKPTSAKTA